MAGTRGVASRQQSISESRWRDPRRYLWLLGLVIPLTPFLAWLGVHLFGLGLFWAAGGIVMLVVIPIVDLVVGADRTNPPDEAMADLENDRYYRWCTYLYLPLQYAGLLVACYAWTTAPMAGAERFAMATTAGIVAGVGINAAHELGHKRPKHERWLAKIALAQSFYGHFYVEHNHGHHLRVATPEDPATARYGESFWAFLPRTVFGGIRSAWRYEKARLARRGRRTWSVRNDVLNAWAMSVVLFAALLVGYGWSIAPWLALQAVFGVVFLEAVNYLEHYGLLRRKLDDGRYERVAPRHSWNSDHVCSNAFLYQLQRHSDHHANPLRRYQTLRSMRDAPQLPAGYAVLVIVAVIPPLWRRVMDPRLLAHYDGNLSRANVHPSLVGK
ncbi:alkane 1-monooxygenase [Rhodococcus olei]|uniref:alkane 1-monooxygenase n=1 Tax=Rhodococcus olei TaxID=2161675 RepID=UPI0031EA3A08